MVIAITESDFYDIDWQEIILKQIRDRFIEADEEWIISMSGVINESE